MTATRTRAVSDVALTLVLVGAVVWIVIHDTSQLEWLGRVTPAVIAGVAAATVGAWLATAVAFRWMLGRLGGELSLGRVLAINVVAGLMNHLPAKPGTAWRAIRLKREHGVSYAQYLSCSAVYSVVSLLVGTLALVGGLVAMSGAPGEAPRALPVVLAAILCAILLVVPWPRVDGAGRIAGFVNRFSEAKAALTAGRGIPWVAVLVVGSVALSALRLAFALQEVGDGQGWIGLLAIGAASAVALRLSVTPAGLGAHELLVGAASEWVGLPLAAGVLAAALVRVVAIVLYVVLGAAGYYLLNRAEPLAEERS